MARKQSGPPPIPRKRPVTAPARTAAAVKAAVGAAPLAKAPEAPRKRTSPAQFFKEVQAEARKTTWTSRRETWITSVMVFGMVIITAVFFVIVDQVLGQGMHLLLNLSA
ncbi:MAG: preprotein translocase subunit SecE [Caulobacteraceae bacterium]|nr:preprotein translocase subunit SecE [Caulobacteraceae bacterium]